jgi:hypothetical protein
MLGVRPGNGGNQQVGAGKEQSAMGFRQWFRRWAERPWQNWPERAYGTRLYQDRLAAVQEHLAERLDQATGPVRIISLCAGDGRDVIGTLARRARGENVQAWLVELNRQSVIEGRRRANRVGVADKVVFVNGDATTYATYRSIPPADIMLACGVWGHVPPCQRRNLVHALACLSQTGGAVIWTRGVARGLHRLREIEAHFEAPSWRQLRLSYTPDGKWALNSYRYCGSRQERPISGRIFNFRLGAGHASERVP